MQLNQWAKHFLVYGLGIVLMNLLPALMIPIYTHRIPPSVYGVVELLNRSQEILILILSLGLRGAMVTFFQFDKGNIEGQRKVYSTSIQFMGVVSLAVIVILLPFSPWMSKLLFNSGEYASAVVLILVATYFETLFQSGVLYIQSELRSTLYVGTYTARAILAILLNLVLVLWLRMGLMGILWATLIHTAVFAAIVTTYMCQRTGFGFDTKLLRELLVFGLPLMAGGFGGFVLNSGDRYFLEATRSSSEVGLYGLGYRLGTVALLLVIQPFLKIWSVTMVDLSKKSDGPHELGRIATYLLCACVFSTLGLSLLGPYVVRFVSTSSYWDAYRVIPIVGAAYILFGWTIIMDASFYVTKRTVYKVYSLSIAGAIATLLYWLLIPRYGMMGAAWATLGGYIAFAALTAFYAQRVYFIHYQYGRIALLFAVGILFYKVGELVPITPVPSGLLLRAVITLGFPVALWLGGFLDVRERKALVDSWYSLHSHFVSNVAARER